MSDLTQPLIQGHTPYSCTDDAPGQPSSEPPIPPQTHVSEQEARDSLLELSDQKLCWGKKAARNMVISSISSSSAYHYELQTFYEARNCKWTHKPYYGDHVDGPHNGLSPSPWSIPVAPDAMFRPQKKAYEVPHTAFVEPCHNCNGRGVNSCGYCKGRGRISCRVCNGNVSQLHLDVDTYESHNHDYRHHRGHGHSHTNVHTHTGVHSGVTVCNHCVGTGHEQCICCAGSGQLNCSTCNTKGSLRHFLMLIVIWAIHMDDHVVESTALPDNLVRGAVGVSSFKESAIRVNPVTHFPNHAINSASRQFVRRHNDLFKSKRKGILMQRHQIRIVPISEVQSDYSGTPFTFWVYGNDNRCHAPEYPQQCCCGCTIL